MVILLFYFFSFLVNMDFSIESFLSFS